MFQKVPGILNPTALPIIKSSEIQYKSERKILLFHLSAHKWYLMAAQYQRGPLTRTNNIIHELIPTQLFEHMKLPYSNHLCPLFSTLTGSISAQFQPHPVSWDCLQLEGQEIEQVTFSMQSLCSSFEILLLPKFTWGFQASLFKLENGS